MRFAASATSDSDSALPPGSNSHFASPQARRRDRWTQPLGARASRPLEHTGGPSAHLRAGRPRLYGPPRHCKGEVVRARRFSCTLVSGLFGGNLGSRALMESAHASPQLPDGLERAQRGLRLVACRSDLSCHRRHFFLATVGDLTAAWNRLVGAVFGGVGLGPRWHWARSDLHGLSTGAGPSTGQSAGGQAVRIAVLAHEPFAVAPYGAAGATW